MARTLLALALTSVWILTLGNRAEQRAIIRGWVRGAAAQNARSSHRKLRGRTSRPHSFSGGDLAILVTEVASRLRAGAPTEVAWRDAWQRLGFDAFLGCDADGTPLNIEALTRTPTWRDVRRVCDVLAVVQARSARVQALRKAAETLGAACRLSASTGAPLALILDAVAEGLEESEAAEEARRIATQGARTSARILQALPLIGVVVAHALGAAPLQRFTDGGFGTFLGVVGAGFFLAARIVSSRLIAKAVASSEGIDEAVACDLARAALESGASIPGVLIALGEATRDESLCAAGRSLRLGTSWKVAWESRASTLLATGLESAWVDGSAPDLLLRRLASQQRSRRAGRARTEAEALGVKLAVPLGSLLLPAFLMLALGPVLMHLVESGFIS